MAKKKKFNVDIAAEAINLVDNERAQWEDATAFVTDRVAFQMRNLIRQLRKNYWGVFDKPTDPMTGRKKIWIPLTESTVESVVKNIDIDTKDVNFRSKHPGGVRLASVVRNIVKYALDKIYFGEKLDRLCRDLAIDGTKVWKTLETDDEDGKKTMQIAEPDLLNIYIDPTAPSIQEAYRFTERGLMTKEEVQGMTGWINTDVTPKEGLSRTDTIVTYGTTDKAVDVWEMWGLIPERLITGLKKDKDEVEGHIVVSGLETGNAVVHLIEKNNGLRPYEEARYTTISGRWYGKGVAEKLVMLQLWINTVVNIRINRSYVSQLGIFKIKKGAGVTPQMLSKLATNGAIMVNNQDDIEQMVMQEASAASYNDEGVIQNWAEKVTSAFEVVTGESLPASTSATATALQSRGAQSQFVLIKEGIGMFIQRWIKRHGMPIIQKTITIGDIIRLEGSPEDLQAIDELHVDNLLYDEIEKNPNLMYDPAQVARERERALDKLSRMGKERYTKLLNNLNLLDYDVQVYVTNEEIDKGVLAQNLISTLNVAPQYANIIIPQVLDVMGLDATQFKFDQEPVQTQPAPGGQPQTNQATVTQANTA